MSRFLLHTALRLCLLGALLVPTAARACASCGCGDPTLTAMGMEKPFRHRIRLALEQRLGVHETQREPERVLISRTALSASYSPTAWLSAAALLPMVASWSAAPRREPRSLYGLGDLELMARALVFRDRSFSPRHLVGILGGVKAPTGPRRSDSSGYPAPDDQQPGSGSWDGLFGASYGYFGDTIAGFLSASYRLTSTGYRGYRRGGVVGATALVQLPVTRSLAITAGLDFSHTQRSVLPSAVPAPDTGGMLLSLSHGVLLALRTDWLLRLTIQTPVVQAWYGAQRESPTGILSLIVDL